LEQQEAATLKMANQENMNSGFVQIRAHGPDNRIHAKGKLQL
jgi:hypothetical protein